jgi:hypothetical protein
MKRRQLHKRHDLWETASTDHLFQVARGGSQDNALESRGFTVHRIGIVSNTGCSEHGDKANKMRAR